MRYCLLLACLLLAACAEEVPRAPVEPLATTEQELAQLYHWGAGPHEVARVSDLEVPHLHRDQQLVFDVFYPDVAEGSFPVLLFAHGNFSDNKQYDALLNHWVSHGYVVLAPQHLDATGGYLGSTINLVRYGNAGLIRARYDDLLSLLDQLDAVAALVPGLEQRMDARRIGATGHSFGAFTAQQFGGASAQDMDTGEYPSLLDSRIQAVLAVSPPGPMFDEINEGSWRKLSAPALLTTGTWDTNPYFWRDWQLHKMAFDTATAENQYALVVQGADHYLGNLICRLELEEAPQHDALAMVNNLSVAFLDAYLKDNAAALDYLRSGDVDRVTGGFAMLEKR